MLGARSINKKEHPHQHHQPSSQQQQQQQQQQNLPSCCLLMMTAAAHCDFLCILALQPPHCCVSYMYTYLGTRAC